MNKIFIKNMVCDRCIMVVKNELEKMNIHIVNITLGEVVLEKELTEQQKISLKKTLLSLGFELLEDKKSEVIEKIKTIIIHLVHQQEEPLKINLSKLLSTEISQDYNYLSNLFSAEEGITIEKYFINQKIEKAKELLIYDQLTLSEIAFKLNYSSVAYLSNQFKKITGFTPSEFKKTKTIQRKPLDKV